MNSGRGVRVLAPEGAIAPTGTWSLGVRAGDFVFVAGMRGINPTNNSLVQGEEARIRQAFMNMKRIAESEGARLADCVRLTVFVTDMSRLRPLVNKLQEELWSGALIRHAPLSRSLRSTRTTFSRWKAPSMHQKPNESENGSWVGGTFWDTYIAK
jgi:2-iminobutanoate/2-iminopropanoate deaminase